MRNMIKMLYSSKGFHSSALSSLFAIETESARYLGRWKIENEQKTNLKADYANDDHCGVCSSFIPSYNDQDDYYMMYMIESVQDMTSQK
jgi:hypothetical protein